METLIPSRVALLVALSGGPGYGAELRARVFERSGGTAVLNDGQIYPILKKLVEDGFVRRVKDWPAIYELTPAGAEMARVEIAEAKAATEAARQFFKDI